jgi:hypothetical protein
MPHESPVTSDNEEQKQELTDEELQEQERRESRELRQVSKLKKEFKDNSNDLEKTDTATKIAMGAGAASYLLLGPGLLFAGAIAIAASEATKRGYILKEREEVKGDLVDKGKPPKETYGGFFTPPSWSQIQEQGKSTLNAAKKAGQQGVKLVGSYASKRSERHDEEDQDYRPSSPSTK